MSKLKGITLICGYLDVQNKPICRLKANCNTIFDHLKGLVSDSSFRVKFYFLKCKWMFQESLSKIEIYIETKKRMKWSNICWCLPEMRQDPEGWEQAQVLGMASKIRGRRWQTGNCGGHGMGCVAYPLTTRCACRLLSCYPKAIRQLRALQLRSGCFSSICCWFKPI